VNLPKPSAPGNAIGNSSSIAVDVGFKVVQANNMRIVAIPVNTLNAETAFLGNIISML
jgi:hypothetical protein